MALMPKVDDILATFMQEIPHFIAADCVSIETGMSVTGGTSMDRNVDASMASSSYVEVIEANGRALDMLGIGSDTMEDIVITAQGAVVLVRPVGRAHYVSVIMTRRGSLSVARAALKKHEDELVKALEAGE